MVGGDADFDHLDPVAGFQHAVADCRGLDEAIARVQPADAALVFIEHVNPASDAENQLKADLMVMHQIRHFAIGHANMAGNHRPTQTVGHQIAVHHARAAWPAPPVAPASSRKRRPWPEITATAGLSAG